MGSCYRVITLCLHFRGLSYLLIYSSQSLGKSPRVVTGHLISTSLSSVLSPLVSNDSHLSRFQPSYKELSWLLPFAQQLQLLSDKFFWLQDLASALHLALWCRPRPSPPLLDLYSKTLLILIFTMCEFFPIRSANVAHIVLKIHCSLHRPRCS